MQEYENGYNWAMDVIENQGLEAANKLEMNCMKTPPYQPKRCKVLFKQS